MTRLETRPPAPAITTGSDHIAALQNALRQLDGELPTLRRWATSMASVLLRDGRLLAVGNGGSAAQAQHLTSELVGRYCHDRQPFSAVALHADTSSVTAITNDYGAEEVFARQVLAHGRRGDILVALSTSGRSSNVVAAATTARHAGMTVWALTGCQPNPLAECAHDSLCIAAPETSTVQEAHLVAVHLLCSFLDQFLGCDGSGP